MLILLFALLVFFTISIFALLLLVEIKNCKILTRLVCIGVFIFVIILDVIFYTHYITFSISMSQTISQRSQMMNTLIAVGRADREFLVGIKSYLQSGQDIAVLENTLADGIESISTSIEPSMIMPEYNYEEHIKIFHKLGYDLLSLSNKTENGDSLKKDEHSVSLDK